MNRLPGALLLAALPLVAFAQPAPPDLKDFVPAPAASTPEAAASAPLQRRCVAGCDGQSARVTWSEDAINRFEEHRDASGRLVRLFVHPRTGAPKYEVLVGAGRDGGKSGSGLRAGNGTGAEVAGPQGNQAVWEIKKF